MQNLQETIEGATRLLVPAEALIEKVPPRKPAFFNPGARLSRDLSIVAYNAYVKNADNKTMADALAGVGARSVRAAVEVHELDEVHINDANPIAMDIARRSSVINNVQERCRFSVNEVCKFLSEHIGRERRFGIVDLDPFGTPAPYLDCALRALADDGLLSITATDTPVLCGIYPDVSVRRYYGRSIHTEYGNEVGLRLLLGLISMTASRLELGVKPLFSHSTRNYLRVYLRLKVGSQYADAMPDSLGYIFHCFSCHNRSFGRRENSKTCCRCNKQMKTAGPLWIDRIMDSVFMDSMQDSLDKCKVDKKCERILAIAREEIGIPTYFSVDRIGEELKITPPAMANIIKALEERGFEASRTSLKASGFRTNAKHEEVLQVLRALVP